MFTFLRWFSVISLIAVVMAAILTGIYFRNMAAEDLKSVVQQNNLSLSQGFINTTWRKYRRLFTEILADVDVKEWPKDKYFVKFSEDAFRYFEDIPIARVTIYNAKGKPFLKTDQSRISFIGSDKLFLSHDGTEQQQQAIRSGKVFSRLIPSGEIQLPDGTKKSGALVQTYVPIIPDSYVNVIAGQDVQIDGYIEVFYDVTAQWEQLYRFQIVGTTGIILIFLILFTALMVTARKAESIIGKQHEKNLELAAAKARAEAASREKSRFLANVSHELRTPLNAIIGFSEIIKNESLGPLGNVKYKDYLRDIHTSGVHLLSLINDILDYSKAEAGKLELEVSDVDATKVVKSCLRMVSPRAQEAQVQLVDNTPKEHFVLTTDAKKLKQILLNLLSNAVKFTKPGGMVTVTAWQNLADDSITIEVKDSGIGIAPKDISKAMSPFGQVDSELSRKYEGTGLGLPLTKKFTEIMGGTFYIQSELGVGTTVTIVLPKRAPEQNWKKASNSGKPSPMRDEADGDDSTFATLDAAPGNGLQLDTGRMA